jgi:hypothetical protein
MFGTDFRCRQTLSAQLSLCFVILMHSLHWWQGDMKDSARSAAATAVMAAGLGLVGLGAANEAQAQPGPFPQWCPGDFWNPVWGPNLDPNHCHGNWNGLAGPPPPQPGPGAQGFHPGGPGKPGGPGHPGGPGGGGIGGGGGGGIGIGGGGGGGGGR